MHWRVFSCKNRSVSWAWTDRGDFVCQNLPVATPEVREDLSIKIYPEVCIRAQSPLHYLSLRSELPWAKIFFLRGTYLRDRCSEKAIASRRRLLGVTGCQGVIVCTLVPQVPHRIDQYGSTRLCRTSLYSVRRQLFPYRASACEPFRNLSRRSNRNFVHEVNDTSIHAIPQGKSSCGAVLPELRILRFLTLNAQAQIKISRHSNFFTSTQQQQLFKTTSRPGLR